MARYRISNFGERLVLTQTTISRLVQIAAALFCTGATSLVVPSLLRGPKPDVFIVVFALLAAGVWGFSLWIACRAARRPETYVFDRSADRVVHNGRPMAPLAAIRRVTCDAGTRTSYVRLRAADGKTLGNIYGDFYECAWLAKGIAEHMGIPWDAPAVFFSRPVRDSWRRAGALFVTATPALAMASALGVAAWKEAKRPASTEYRCTVVGKTVGRTGSMYRPQFTLAIHVPPRMITFQPGSGYEDSLSSPSRAAMERILDSYEVDHTYPCWYGVGYGPFLARKATPWAYYAGLGAFLPIAIVIGRRAYRSLDEDIARGTPAQPVPPTAAA